MSFKTISGNPLCWFSCVTSHYSLRYLATLTQTHVQRPPLPQSIYVLKAKPKALDTLAHSDPPCVDKSRKKTRHVLQEPSSEIACFSIVIAIARVRLISLFSLSVGNSILSFLLFPVMRRCILVLVVYIFSFRYL